MEKYYSGLNFVLNGIALRTAQCADNTYPLYYGIQYIHSGSCYLSVNRGPVYQLKGPVAFLTSPGVLFSYGSPPDTFRQQYHVCANGERMEDYLRTGLFQKADQRKEPFYRITSPERFLADMLELIFLIRSERKYSFAVNRFEYLLLSLQQQETVPEKDFYYRTAFEQLVLRIMEKPEAEWDFSSEAEKMNISLKHFMRLFKKAYGMPPMHYVLKQRIFKACSLLALQNDPVKNIADECGFNSAYYFSRLFRQYMLVPPEQYRNSFSRKGITYENNRIH